MAAEPLQRLVESYRHFDQFHEAHAELYRHLGKLEGLRVLEAGCGANSNLEMENCAVVGVDISPHQLNRNKSAQVKICADLCTHENESWTHSFDLIVCWDVLEHLKSPRTVLEKFGRWLKPDGRLVLVFPNAQTLKGQVTKHSPYFFHKLFYRIASGTPINADKEDKGPFKTVTANEIKIQEVINSLEQYFFTLTLLLSFESYQNKWIKRYVPHGLVDNVNKMFLGSLRNAVDPSATDFILVASRQAD
jgi:cyclopropane fatty-acyl-phospholipid synthase-like methyltransferase